MFLNLKFLRELSTVDEFLYNCSQGCNSSITFNHCFNRKQCMYAVCILLSSVVEVTLKNYERLTIFSSVLFRLLFEALFTSFVYLFLFCFSLIPRTYNTASVFTMEWYIFGLSKFVVCFGTTKGNTWGLQLVNESSH